MNENSPDGCYGLRCRDCKLRRSDSVEDKAECQRLCDLATKRMGRDMTH